MACGVSIWLQLGLPTWKRSPIRMRTSGESISNATTHGEIWIFESPIEVIQAHNSSPLSHSITNPFFEDGGSVTASSSFANPLQTDTATSAPVGSQATPSSAADAKKPGSHTTRCHLAVVRWRTSPRRTPHALAACHRQSHASYSSHSAVGRGMDSPTTARRCSPPWPRSGQALAP